MRAVSHLKALQALEAAVRTGSLRSAAEELALTAAAVGQRIKALEDYLGVELLTRGHGGVVPTAALATALPALRTAFSELNRVAAALELHRPLEIHVVADSDWAALWLEPRLPTFRRLCANTLLCINGIGDVPSRPEDADAEVWFGPTRGRPHEYPLFRDWLLPVSSPENTLRLGTLPAESRLEGFPLLHLDCYRADPTAIGWQAWTSRFGQRRVAVGRGMRYRHAVPALEAVSSHAGLALCGLALVQTRIAEGTLALPFAPHQGAWTGERYRVSFSAAAVSRPQVIEFRDWLLAEAATTERLVEQCTAA
ncbi:MAG: LysR family transcriptional regulator [Gammaproteobacteria bacterium]|nr:MAG: LysR family transcriptional regulator [Gammaproteobacteria bacterium]